MIEMQKDCTNQKAPESCCAIVIHKHNVLSEYWAYVLFHITKIVKQASVQKNTHISRITHKETGKQLKLTTNRHVPKNSERVSFARLFLRAILSKQLLFSFMSKVLYLLLLLSLLVASASDILFCKFWVPI